MRQRMPFWNVWWTLTVISAVFTVVVMFLEYLGVFRNLGLLLGGLGLVATMVFGVASATRASIDSVEISLERIELKLDKLDRIEAQLGALDRIEALLRERLPRPG